jgi:hypothetical protein
MQKLLSALVAMLSFVGVLSGLAVRPVTAQDRPPANEQDGTAPKPASAQDATALVLPPGVTHENVEVKDRPLIIEGDVRGSVHAVNSRVTLMPGAAIEGNLSMERGSLLVAPAAGAVASSVALNGPVTGHQSMHRGNKRDWFGGQFCLWLLGLAGSLIVLLAAPNATSRVSETVSVRPGRSLLVGSVAAAAMFSALAVSGAIMGTKSFLSLLWTPVMIVIALVSLFLLVFGWLAGVRRVGDLLAGRFGQTGSGSFYGRTVLGLTVFFAANALLGAVNPALGAVGLLVEFAVALMGIGAIVQTGFGRDDEWLGRRFRRSPGEGMG